MKKKIKILFLLIGLSIIFLMFLIFSNSFIKAFTKDNIDSQINEKMDAILVLGCAVWGTEPSPMLKDRLDRAIELYNEGYAEKIIMSGDKTGDDHSEVNTMKKYAIDHGVDSTHIYLDYYGLSTYDSIYRAKHVFNVNNLIVVTQPYHLYRAVAIGLWQEMNIYGVSSEGNDYSGQFKRDVREFLARPKDMIKCLIMPEATYVEGTINLEESGDYTNDNSINEYLLAN